MEVKEVEVDETDDIEAGNEDQKVPLETKVAADVPSGPPPFDFFRELNIMNKQVVALRDYSTRNSDPFQLTTAGGQIGGQK